MNRGTCYALHAIAFLARQRTSDPLHASHIAAACRIPPDYLCKILQQLTRAGLLRGEGGRRGGFLLARPSGQISLLEIVEAIDGPMEPARADQGRAGASNRARAQLDGVAQRAAAAARKVLRGVSLRSLANA